MRKARIYYTPVFLEHDTGHHPECAERLTVCLARLDSAAGCTMERIAPQKATQADLRAVHAARLIESIESMASMGGGAPDPDTVVSRGSYEAALYAAGAAIDAAAAVAEGRCDTALALVRPPGHHATRDQALGFCLFNNIAAAARRLIARDAASRVAILDFDVHHGNGTQDIFYEDPAVLCVSFHRFPFYPGSGRRDETGSGAGKGYTVNVPLPYNTAASKYLSLWERVLDERVRPFAPDIILVSAGFDNYRCDPVGGLNFEQSDFRKLGQAILRMADGVCRGKVVSVLEGGYDLEALPGCLEAYLQGLEAIAPRGE